jgi:hypothetical protein
VAKVVYGEASSTTLLPHLLRAGEHSTASKVKELRAFFRKQQLPESEQRPACEARWQQQLGVNITAAQWEELWKTVHEAPVDGSARSTMWRVLHDCLPLLTDAWYRAPLGLPSTCIMCSTGAEETAQHLFSSCPAAEGIWHFVATAVRNAGLEGTDQISCRLLGWPLTVDQEMYDTRWPTRSSPPSIDQLEAWAASAWAAVRGSVIHAIWLSRCRVLHRKLNRNNAVYEIKGNMRTSLAYLVHRFVPRLCPWRLTRMGKAPRPQHANFLRLFWTCLAAI